MDYSVAVFALERKPPLRSLLAPFPHPRPPAPRRRRPDRPWIARHEQHLQLGRFQHAGRLGGAVWPEAEATPGQPLVTKPKPLAVVTYHAYRRLPATAEHEQSPG